MPLGDAVHQEARHWNAEVSVREYHNRPLDQWIELVGPEVTVLLDLLVAFLPEAMKGCGCRSEEGRDFVRGRDEIEWLYGRLGDRLLAESRVGPSGREEREPNRHELFD